MDRRRIGGKGHAAEEMVLGHRSMAGPQKVHVLSALHKADMRHRMDEIRGGSHQAIGGRRAPKLLRLLELLEYPHCSADWHPAVRISRRCVAHLTQSRVARARIVPAIRGFRGQVLGSLNHLDTQTRVEPLEHHPERRGHDAAADEDDIGSFQEADIPVRWRLHGFKRQSLAPMRPLGLDINCIETAAGSHEEPIPARASETNVAAHFR